MSLANRLSILRILLTPFITGFLIYSHTKEAVLLRYGASFLFFGCALTDAVDGFVARRFGQVTELGRFLDPLADKLLISTVFIVLTLIGEIPLWVTVIVVGRDLMVAMGCVALYFFIGKEKVASIRPSFLGKMATFLQMLTLFFLLLDPQGNWYHHISCLMYTMVVVTVFSAIDYMWEGSRRFK
jgi:CDP-diacylglycerol--glycerol-3-phosphate 3-phosphatidyltransferase